MPDNQLPLTTKMKKVEFSNLQRAAFSFRKKGRSTKLRPFVYYCCLKLELRGAFEAEIVGDDHDRDTGLADDVFGSLVEPAAEEALGGHAADDDEVGAVLVDNAEHFVFHGARSKNDGGFAVEVRLHVFGKFRFILLLAFLDEFADLDAGGTAHEIFAVRSYMHDSELGIVLLGDVIHILSDIIGVFREVDATNDIRKDRHSFLQKFKIPGFEAFV